MKTTWILAYRKRKGWRYLRPRFMTRFIATYIATIDSAKYQVHRVVLNSDKTAVVKDLGKWQTRKLFG